MKLSELFNKVTQEKATDKERKLFGEWFDELDLSESSAQVSAEQENEIETKIEQGIFQHILQRKKRLVRLYRYSSAAAVFVFLLLGYFFLMQKRSNTPPTNQQIAGSDIRPGRDVALLTLPDGRTINLDTMQSGSLAHQPAGISIVKDSAGHLIYQSTTTRASTGFNTLTTPRGGQYQVRLPDGSNVWLNAESSIRFPVAFSGSTREVSITGEAYFEVAHIPQKPFRVSAKGQVVEVLGTHFNINAYDDEPVMKTTLLEGSVNVFKGNIKRLLKPGQQAIINEDSDNINVKSVSTDEAVAWKNAYFYFDNESLQSILREIARWYNVEIQYKYGQPISEQFGGSINRFNNVSEVLKLLEMTGNVHFEIQGRTIIVYPK